MYCIKLIFILVGLFPFHIALAQSPKTVSGAIEWNEHFSLSWEDFRGARPVDARGDAGTFIRIEAKPYKNGKQVHYRVRALFLKNKSWVTDPSPSLLEHERLHFDLAELYARKIRKRVKELRQNGVTDIGDYNHAIKALLEESNQADVRYDMETLHGALDKKQAQWKARMDRELKALDQYRHRKNIVESR